PSHYAKHRFYFFVRLLRPHASWLSLLWFSFLLERCSMLMVEEFADSSYAPWSRVASEILAQEQGHPDRSERFITAHIGHVGRKRVQRALRPWWPLALNIFGPPHTAGTEVYLRLGLKTRTGEERRALFRRRTEPAIQALGLTVPPLWRTAYPFL